LLEMKLKADSFRVLNERIVPPFPTYRPDEFRAKFNGIINKNLEVRRHRKLHAGSKDPDAD
jgi:hypothetical protein